MGLRLSLVLLFAVAAGCGPPGDTPHAGTRVYEAPDGAYRIHYLHPPWMLVDADGTRARFTIESNASRVGIHDAGVPPKYELVITIEEGSARALARRAERRAPRRAETVTEPTRAFTGDEGAVIAWEVLTRTMATPIRRFRRVYFDHPSGSVVRLVFEANPELDDAEVDAMIRGVVIAPES